MDEIRTLSLYKMIEGQDAELLSIITLFIVLLHVHHLKLTLALTIMLIRLPVRFPLVALYVICISTCLVRSQNQTAPTTDPDEARTLNSIFSKWGITAEPGWNISGEICSGVALSTDATKIDDPEISPLIKCDCSFNNNTLCRIRELKVSRLSVEGPIPEELWTLTRLTNLNLGQNVLTGPLSRSIGNLTRMQWLTFGINSLSGEIPKEVGLLTDLRSFAIGANNFSGSLPPDLGNCRRLEQLGIGANNSSGSLPPELGNCLRLEQLYIDSSGVRGEIPRTFSNLQNLVTVWASDTELTGRIPDFIGNWSKLATLRFQGNSFEGPIPSTFSNLTSMTELRISDLTNGSSSLEFIKDLKSLSILVLRNNNISDSIPPNIGEFQNLTQLDLSFNNLTGDIPAALFNMSRLRHLFLGNNRLNGSLPAQKSSSLLAIDVSYNNLAGTLPSWVHEQNLQVNLVVNNFTVESSENRALPSGLNCLQRNFPCNRGKGAFFNFSIKSGGPQITSTSGIVFERDNETLGAATYFVANTNRWAVSNVGLPTGSNNPQFIFKSQSQFANMDSELFQTARISASSLRYYGLGLENGNYTVNLQFAELQIEDSTWRSVGRRVFDIYVQGILAFKDFDILKEAGGSKRAISKEFKAQVSENHLEVHLFWAGKGTCCVPEQGAYGPSISAISATPDFLPTVRNNPPSTEKNKTGMIAGIIVGVAVVGFICILAVFCIIQRRKKSRANDDDELLGIDARPYTFSYAELRTATEDFSPANKVGEGGFGPVFKGKLNDGRVIAVKQLSVASHQGKTQFITEIATISAVQHRNLVKLYGCCIEGDNRLLVYEFLPNKSLDQALFGNKNLNLDWSTRFEICLGVARGLAYLHEESRVRIVHRDVKSSNILLDSELIPKISDFGLAKLYDDKKTHISTRVAGTIGYLAPEYAMRGHLTEKADVFGFGVVALEIVSGRPNSDSSLDGKRMYLLEWAWNLHENNQDLELVDSSLTKINEEEVKRVIGVALLCTQTSPALRPPMSRVVAMLSGDIEVTGVISRPGYLTDWKFDDTTSFMSDYKEADNSYCNSSISTSMISNSPLNDHKPMLSESIGEGR